MSKDWGKGARELEWVSEWGHRITHATAPHILPHCMYHGTAHTTALQHHLNALTSHCNQHPTHPIAPHIPQLCTSHPTATHIPHMPPHSTHFPPQQTSYCTAHPTARPTKANVFLVLKPGHLLFTGPPCLAWQKIPVHTKDLAFLILSPCSICV